MWSNGEYKKNKDREKREKNLTSFQKKISRLSSHFRISSPSFRNHFQLSVWIPESRTPFERQSKGDQRYYVGQLATQHSCSVLQATLPSQTCAIEANISRLTQMTSSTISIFEVCCWCAFSTFSDAFRRSFSSRSRRSIGNLSRLRQASSNSTINMCTDETALFRLIQVICGGVSIFVVCC